MLLSASSIGCFEKIKSLKSTHDTEYFLWPQYFWGKCDKLERIVEKCQQTALFFEMKRSRNFCGWRPLRDGNFQTVETVRKRPRPACRFAVYIILMLAVSFVSVLVAIQWLNLKEGLEACHAGGVSAFRLLASRPEEAMMDCIIKHFVDD